MSENKKPAAEQLDKKTQETVNSLKQQVKTLFAPFGIDLDMIAQLGAPHLRRDSAKRANEAKANISKDHFSRSDNAERLYNVLALSLKNFAGTLPAGVTRTLLKEAGEYIESFTQVFCNEEESGGSGKHEAGTAQDLLTPVKASRLKEQQERLAKASSANAPALRQQILDDTKALAEAEEIMLKGIEKPKAQKEPGVPLSDQIGEVLGKVNDSIERNLGPAVDMLGKTEKKWKKDIEDAALKERTEASLRFIKGESFGRKCLRVIFGI